jgi:hypothetical protein
MFRTLSSLLRNGSWRGAAAVAAIALSVSACGSDPEKSRVQSEMSSLKSFLRDGATRRDEVIVRLGIPHATFENDRIIGYYLSARDELILVFDAQGRLARHRFLKFPKTQP